MTISSFSDRRRYFDRSSLTSDRATRFIVLSMFREPCVNLGFLHDRQDLDRLFSHIVKHANVVACAKSILRMRQTAQPFDAALAHFGRLMPQMLFDGVTHRGADIFF